jgi:hypothetical protein
MRNFPDYLTIAADLCERFNMGEGALTRVHTALCYVDATRFAIPHVKGLELALRRPHGMGLRKAAETPTAPDILELDAVTCDSAWLLELMDRCGCFEAMTAVAEAIATDNALIDVEQFPLREDPVVPSLIKPIVRESLGTLFRSLTGRAPSRKRDFRRKGNRLVAVDGSPAHFIREALNACGWSFTDADIAHSYVFVPLKREWEAGVKRA